MFTGGVFFKLLSKSSLCNHIIVAVEERNIRVFISQPTNIEVFKCLRPLVWFESVSQKR